MPIHDKEFVDAISAKTEELFHLYTDETTPEIYFNALCTAISVFLQTQFGFSDGKIYQEIDRLHTLLVESVDAERQNSAEEVND